MIDENIKEAAITHANVPSALGKLLPLRHSHIKPELRTALYVSDIFYLFSLLLSN